MNSKKQNDQKIDEQIKIETDLKVNEDQQINRLKYKIIRSSDRYISLGQWLNKQWLKHYPNFNRLKIGSKY